MEVAERMSELLNNFSLVGPMSREKVGFLLSMNIHEDKCSELQIINLFIIQTLETSFFILEPWETECIWQTEKKNEN